MPLFAPRVKLSAGITVLMAVLGAGTTPDLLGANTSQYAPLTEKQIHRNRHILESASEYATYAILSDNAYPREHPLPLPAGWARVQDRQLSDTGLALVVYERRTGTDLAEVAVVFRGSDEGKDWIHNLAPFYRIQVPPAEKEFAAVLDHYRPQGVKIVATGHSLGGGLAFHMSFVHPNVEAIAFNSSPVTKAGSKIQPNKRTSVWESGEGLQAPRNAVNLARVRWHDVKRVEVNFATGSPVKQHRMGELALNLTKLAARSSGEFQSILVAYCQAKPATPPSGIPPPLPSP